jgi:sigma-B regulation protein RsbU (phosphoserine phosphatase)
LLQRRSEKELVFSLNHRVLQLNSLIDTGIEVSKLKQEGSLHQLALERAAVLTNASRGLLIVSSGGRETERYAFPTSNIPAEGISENHRIQTSFTYLDNSYAFELFEKESRSGVIPFDETDQLLLNALARQVDASLENRYLLNEAIEKQRTDQEISVAASIQQRILPKSLPSIEGFDISGINIASKSVGGDYYDCVPLSDGSFALVIADVAGKGIPAGLLVSSFHAYLNAYLETKISLVQLAQQLNRAICKASTDDKFITAFLALLDPRTGELESLSAAHNPVYLVKNDRTIQELNAGGVALGMLDMDFPYQSEASVIEKGECLLLYTDGVTEAINEQEQLYDTVSPLKQFTLDNFSHPAETFIQSLIADIRRFAGAAPQVDDITALYLRRL